MGAVSVKPDQRCRCAVVYTDTETRDEHLSVRLENNAFDRTGDSCSGSERRVDAAIRIKSDQPACGTAVHAVEEAGGDDLSVRLCRQTSNISGLERGRRETRVKRAAAVQHSDRVSVDACELCKAAADKVRSAGRYRHRPDAAG